MKDPKGQFEQIDYLVFSQREFVHTTFEKCSIWVEDSRLGAENGSLFEYNLRICVHPFCRIMSKSLNLLKKKLYR